MKECDQQIRIWLVSNGISLELYNNLSSPDQKVLCGIRSTPNYVSSAAQRKKLYQCLNISECREGGLSGSANNLPNDEEIEKYFSPKSSDKGLPYSYKF